MSSVVGRVIAKVGLLPADNPFSVSPLWANFLRTTPSSKVRTRYPN